MSERLNRRQFMPSLAAGAAALGAAPIVARAEAVASSSKADGRTFQEPAREVPIVEHTDVLVCGAGPAGVAAALAAARTGAKVRLLEVHGCLGGVWTAGALSWILDAKNKPGLMAEIRTHLERRGAGGFQVGAVAYDVEMMKVLLEEMCLTAGIKIQLYTRVVAAHRNDKNRLSVVVTESKSGRQAWSAGTFIDTTGDGDLAALAGCQFDYGREGTGETQPMSLMALLTGLDVEKIKKYVRGKSWAEPKDELFALMSAAGALPSYAKPTLFHIREDLYALMANHEYNVSALDTQALTDATFRARRELHTIIDALKKKYPEWSGAKIVATGEQIGVREGRRIRGLYQVTQEDVAVGQTHDDAVCRVTFGIDVHSTRPKETKAIEKAPFKSRPYDIPLRALIAKDVEGLMMAGRCISGDFLSHSSYRVTGNAVAMGQAAGITAALAATSSRLPREVPYSDVSPVLAKQQFEPVLKG